jgi:hypothetical protein
MEAAVLGRLAASPISQEVDLPGRMLRSEITKAPAM